LKESLLSGNQGQPQKKARWP